MVAPCRQSSLKAPLCPAMFTILRFSSKKESSCSSHLIFFVFCFYDGMENILKVIKK